MRRGNRTSNDTLKKYNLKQDKKNKLFLINNEMMS